jgi:hypothetical protein
VQLKGELKADHKALKTALRASAPDKAAAATAKRDALITQFKNANQRRK